MKNYVPSSIAKIKAAAELELRRRRLAERDAAIAAWRRIARPEQLPPPDSDWLVWYIQAGRGWGKTRTGAEYTYQMSWDVPRLAIVAESFGDGRDLCVEGESGIKTLHPDVQFNRSLGELMFPSGARGKIYSAEDPESLRGPNNYFAWCDEIAKWRYLEETWNTLMFTMRRGARPRIVVTTTPKPRAFLNTIKTQPTTRLVIRSTYDNIANLSPVFLSTIVQQYEHTTLGRQELYAEDIDDDPAALWSRAVIEQQRVVRAPDLVRVVTAIDPSATAGGDEAGIVTAGVGWCTCNGNRELHAFLLADDSVRASPELWARAAVTAYHKHRADALIAESNNGGEMVRVTIATIPNAPPVRLVTASRSKQTRAEPVAMLTQQGKIHFVGTFEKLEAELCSWVPGDASPNRLDAFVWACTELMLKNIDMHRIVDYYERRAAQQQEVARGAASV